MFLETFFRVRGRAMDLLSLLNSQLQDQDVVKKISKQVGAKPDQVKQLTELALQPYYKP